MPFFISYITSFYISISSINLTKSNFFTFLFLNIINFLYQKIRILLIFMENYDIFMITSNIRRFLMSTKYQTLAEQLKKELSDNLARGVSKLPTEKALCEKFQVSRQTVRQALSLLEKEKLIARRQGSGSYATGLLPETNKNRVAILLSSDTEYIFRHF